MRGPTHRSLRPLAPACKIPQTPPLASVRRFMWLDASEEPKLAEELIGGLGEYSDDDAESAVPALPAFVAYRSAGRTRIVRMATPPFTASKISNFVDRVVGGDGVSAAVPRSAASAAQSSACLSAPHGPLWLAYQSRAARAVARPS